MRNATRKELLRTETVDRGGIGYEVRAVHGEGQIWGEWTCGKCGNSGGSRSPSASIEDAIKAARIHLGPHHKMVHGGNWIDDKA